MEKDGKTRLYYHHDRRGDTPSMICEAWPSSKNFTRDSWTTGAAADETFANADFICVSCLSRKGDHWIVTVPKEGGSEFKVDYLSPSQSNYAQLAKHLEERAGKKGLTVIIY